MLPVHGPAQGMSATLKLLDWIGAIVARTLTKPTSGYEPYAAARPELVAMTIRPADVLLAPPGELPTPHGATTRLALWHEPQCQRTLRQQAALPAPLEQRR